jgi:hypothetical protein
LNTGVQLIQVDRNQGSRLEEIEQFMKPICEEALKYFDRCNCLEFDVDNDQEAPWADLDLSDPSNWQHVHYKIRYVWEPCSVCLL